MLFSAVSAKTGEGIYEIYEMLATEIKHKILDNK
jgi:hypothetical protein